MRYLCIESSDVPNTLKTNDVFSEFMNYREARASDDSSDRSVELLTFCESFCESGRKWAD